MAVDGDFVSLGRQRCRSVRSRRRSWVVGQTRSGTRCGQPARRQLLPRAAGRPWVCRRCGCDLARPSGVRRLPDSVALAGVLPPRLQRRPPCSGLSACGLGREMTCLSLERRNDGQLRRPFRLIVPLLSNSAVNSTVCPGAEESRVAVPVTCTLGARARRQPARIGSGCSRRMSTARDNRLIVPWISPAVHRRCCRFCRFTGVGDCTGLKAMPSRLSSKAAARKCVTWASSWEVAFPAVPCLSCEGSSDSARNSARYGRLFTIPSSVPIFLHFKMPLASVPSDSHPLMPPRMAGRAVLLRRGLPSKIGANVEGTLQPRCLPSTTMNPKDRSRLPFPSLSP